MSEKRTVYFLGAGASADAGVPLTKALLTKIRKNIKGRSYLNRFIQEFGFLDNQSTGRPPIAEAISLLDSCLRENRPLSHFFNIERLRIVRSHLTTELSRVIRRCNVAGAKVRIPEDAQDQPGAKGRKVPMYFKRFAKKLRPRNREVNRPEDESGLRLRPGDAIITTNYDTNIDVALYELIYATEGSFTDAFLGSNFLDPYTDLDALTEPEATIDLFKLHGSLNWLYCPRCSRIYVAAFGFTVLYLERKSQHKNELTCHCGYYYLEPVIIAPSVYQDIINPHLQAIWTNAYHVLETADRWVFIGYSLPTEDLAVRSLLYRAKSGRSYKIGVPPEIQVVCPKDFIKELRPRYVSLFGKTVKFDGRRFRDYVYPR